MAIDTAPVLIRAPRAAVGVRSDTTRVLLDIGEALAPLLEGQALCDDVAAGVERIRNAAQAGSRMAVLNEAGRLGYRAQGYRARFRRMAAEIEGPEDAA